MCSLLTGADAEARKTNIHVLVETDNWQDTLTLELELLRPLPELSDAIAQNSSLAQLQVAPVS